MVSLFESVSQGQDKIDLGFHNPNCQLFQGEDHKVLKVRNGNVNTHFSPYSWYLCCIKFKLIKLGEKNKANKPWYLLRVFMSISPFMWQKFINNDIQLLQNFGVNLWDAKIPPVLNFSFDKTAWEFPVEFCEHFYILLLEKAVFS